MTDHWPAPDQYLRLPWEVLERVVDYAYPDTKLLLSFSYTSRQLIPRSRMLLVRNVCIQTKVKLDSFWTFMQQYHGLRYCVEHFTIAPSADEPNPESLLSTFPADLIRTLPRLQSWNMQVLEDHPYAPVVAAFPPRVLLSLRSFWPISNLYIGPLTFASCGEFVRLIANFPDTLKCLHCTDIEFVHEQDSAERISRIVDSRRHTMGLTTLHVSHYWNQYMHILTQLHR